MNNKTLGIIFIIIGVALAMWGYDIYNSAGSQISRTLSGDTPIKSLAAMAGGVISVLIGIKKIK